MYAKHKSINIFYTDHGKGNTIVLLHGFLENAKMWEPFIPSLSKKNRIICIDLLGHGKTECMGYVHNMELMAETVQAILNHLNIKNATIVGHSMGGYVALAFAEKNPKSVNGLCLMNSTPNSDNLEKQQNRNRAIDAVKKNHAIFIRMAINNLFQPENRILFAEKINHIIEDAQQTPLQGIIAALEGMKIRKDRTSLFNTIPCKKMLILGRKDSVLHIKTIASLVKDPTVDIIELPDGHMSHVENKDEFLRNLMRFVEKKCFLSI